MSRWIRLSIAGMACAGCVSAVEKALLGVEGVESAVVNLAERTARVKSQNPVEELIRAVEQAGYQAAQLRDRSDEALKQSREQVEYRRLWLRVLIAGSIAAVMFVGGMGGLLPPIQQGQSIWLLISLVTLMLLTFVGGHFFTGAWRALRAGRANMDSLIALGTGSAWLYSSAVVLMPDKLPVLAQHAYFEAAIIIIALVSLGSALEQRARSNTAEAIRRLISLQPDTARVIRDGQEYDVPVEQIGLDDTLRIRPGERIPVDGSIVQGNSHLDESMLTGEPMPVGRETGDTVYCGTLNQEGGFLMQATGIGQQTALARIIELVREAQSSKPRIARLVDKIAALFVPVVVMVAVTAFVVWWAFGPEPSLAFAIVTAMTVLVIACPCALGLATPISIMVAVGRAAQMGILVRNGEALQAASEIDTIVLDKTGTVTRGRPDLTRIHVAPDITERDALAMAAALETASSHPLARAILEAAQKQGVEIRPVEDFRQVAGFGVEGNIQGHRILLGSGRYLRQQGVDTAPLDEIARGWAGDGATPVYLSRDAQVVACLAIADRPRSTALKAVASLQDAGFNVMLLTGDNRQTAEAVARELGIKQVIAEVLPADKADHIRLLQHQGHRVAMVGDGINDSPALAQADVGIAVGSGAEVAIHAADMTLMGHSLQAVAGAMNLSRATMTNIRQNLFGAFIYNVVGIPVAAGVLYPSFGLLLSPVFAATAMSLSSVTVVSNALRLKSISLT